MKRLQLNAASQKGRPKLQQQAEGTAGVLEWPGKRIKSPLYLVDKQTTDLGSPCMGPQHCQPQVPCKQKLLPAGWGSAGASGHGGKFPTTYWSRYFLAAQEEDQSRTGIHTEDPALEKVYPEGWVHTGTGKMFEEEEVSERGCYRITTIPHSHSPYAAGVGGGKELGMKEWSSASEEVGRRCFKFLSLFLTMLLNL